MQGSLRQLFEDEEKRYRSRLQSASESKESFRNSKESAYEEMAKKLVYFNSLIDECDTAIRYYETVLERIKEELDKLSAEEKPNDV